MIDERKQIIKDVLHELKYFVVSIAFIVIMIITWDYELINENVSNFATLIFIFLSFGPIISRLMIYSRTRLKGINYVYPDIFECNYTTESDLIERVRNRARLHGYIYEKYLETFHDEKFTIFTQENPDENKFVKKKIGIYRAKKYIAERYHNQKLGIEDGETFYNSYLTYAEIRPPYKPFYKLVCGKWGRNYCLPKEWVGMEMILIIIVDEWNYSLRLLLDAAEQMPYVLFTVINTNEPDRIYIAKDNRKEKKDDYNQIRQELFYLLGINGSPIIEDENFQYNDNL